MATSADEFDPPANVLTAVLRGAIEPELLSLSRETQIPYVAKISVWVRDQEFPKYSVSARGVADYGIEENTAVRVRFRRTYRDDRLLLSIETQHAGVWRSTGFSGIRLRGDLLLGPEVVVRLRSKTICYNQGWHGW